MSHVIGSFLTFSHWRLRDRTLGILVEIDSTVGDLRTEPHHLWSVLYYCLQPRFDHWLLQHCAPADVAASAGLVDDALLPATRACLGRGAGLDP
eukprot:1021866-Pleurochrysis_carterae.AAC.1